MNLYSIKGTNLNSIKLKPFEKEREIQNIVEKNTNTLFDIDFVCSEFKIGQFRIDTLCFDNETNSFVIIEYKKGSSYSVIDQGYSYLSKMLNNKSDFILEYNEQKNNNLKRDEIDWSQSKIIFVSPSFNSFQKNSVNFKGMNKFELWEIKRFDNNTISLNQHQSNSSESIEQVVNNSDSIINKVNKEIKNYDESYLLKNSNETILSMWNKIRNYITSEYFIDTRFNYTKSYNRFSLNNNSPICYFKFQKNKIYVSITGGTDYRTENRKGKNYVELEDPKGLTKRKEKLWTTNKEEIQKGIKVFGVRFEISISQMKEVDYVLSLIKQKFDKMNP